MKRTRKKPVPKEIRDHWQRVVRLGCVVTFDDLATIHHVHGGSIISRFGGNLRGISQKTNDYLVIPLHPRLHTGEQGIDSGMGVARWEAKFGTQLGYLEQVRQQIKNRHGYDIFEKAGLL